MIKAKQDEFVCVLLVHAGREVTVDTEDYTSARRARGGGAPGGG